MSEKIKISSNSKESLKTTAANNDSSEKEPKDQCLNITSNGLDKASAKSSVQSQQKMNGSASPDFGVSIEATEKIGMAPLRKKQGRRKHHGSVCSVIPHNQFGPKAYLDNNAGNLTIPDPSNQKLTWQEPIQSVLVIRKHLDSNVLIPFSKMVAWLVKVKKLCVYVEHSVMTDPNIAAIEDFNEVKDRLVPFVEGEEDLTNKVDFIICLGGDGTLLYASSLFQVDVPPVMAFNMGSLGFLTPFQFENNFQQSVSKVMDGSPSVLLHYRLKCVLMNAGSTKVSHIKNISTNHSDVKAHKLVLNEVVVDRGPSSYLSNFELYIEGRMVTSVQGDGLIISTPTGSTAYAVAAGASMVHPSVPCILITPICPHSLSFRPIVVPAGVEIKVMLSPNARNTSMVSFDGRDRLEMLHGDRLLITTALYPVPSICAADQMEDWFESLAVCLNWNVRRPQKALESSTSHSSLLSLDDSDTSSTVND